MTRIAVIGAGAWGTALAQTAARNGHAVRLWAHDPATARTIAERRENAAYLPGVMLDAGIAVTADPAEAATGAELVLLAAPAQHLRQVCAALQPGWPQGAAAVICAKGIETETGALMSEVVAAELPGAASFVLSGPTFAIEVARGLPTAATVAGRDPARAAEIAAALGSRHFRLYSSADPVGAEVGGAVKNVIAIAAGVVEGRRLGDNARAALITRGLAEMTRLAVALGGDARTLMGLAGLGDLTLTCSAAQSRNFSLGIALGRGERLADILAARRSVAEGVATARAVGTLARKHGIDMPICFAVEHVLHDDAALDAAIAGLLERPFREEL